MFGRRWLRIAFPIALVVSVTVGAAYRYAQQEYTFPGPLEASRTVVIPHGSPEIVGKTLLDAGVIRSVREFQAAAMATRSDGPLHAAEFAFPRGASLREVLQILRTGRQVEHRITIPEGLTAAQIALLLDHADALTGETPIPGEGAILPETYSYERGATRASIVARATTAMDRALAETWSQRASGLPLATPRDLLTLASIVERETGHDEERPRVAAVFLNRLREGMRLQSDPTVIYAVSGGSGTIPRLLTRADLAWPNPYNTYQISGLPPGPIDSPGIATLMAVAHPSQTDDLYFVADGTGHHAFARTLEDHNRNVARWRAINAPSTVAPSASATPSGRTPAR